MEKTDTDKFGDNALHFASRKYHEEIVQLLIEKGIDINQKDSDGENALHLASHLIILIFYIHFVKIF